MNRNKDRNSKGWYKGFFCIGVILVLALLLLSYTSGGLMGILLDGEMTPSERIKLIQVYFLSWGILAPVAYVVFVMLEVIVAPIPGLMLYAPGGVIFGGFLGGLLALIGNVVGAGMSCQLMRVFGRVRLEPFLNRKGFQEYDQRLGRAGIWVIVALRINPLTSSDLVSYAAGLTSIPVWKVMLGTFLGMAPLCWAQAYLADELLRVFPRLIYPLIGLCFVYGIVVIAVTRKTLAGKHYSA